MASSLTRIAPLSHTKRPLTRACFPRRVCRVRASEVDEDLPPPQLTADSLDTEPTSANGLLAGGAVGLGVGLFLFTRVLTSGPTFTDLEAQAVPYDLAQANGKPTVVEFYAKWCEVCREMLPDTLSVEEEYKENINFVALNVENGKWTPEMLQYGVDGIPHFVFIGADKSEQGYAIGRLPRRVLEGHTFKPCAKCGEMWCVADVKALADKSPLPYKQVSFEASQLRKTPTTMSGPSMPRDHGP